MNTLDLFVIPIPLETSATAVSESLLVDMGFLPEDISLLASIPERLEKFIQRGFSLGDAFRYACIEEYNERGGIYGVQDPNSNRVFYVSYAGQAIHPNRYLGVIEDHEHARIRVCILDPLMNIYREIGIFFADNTCSPSRELYFEI